jgi:osmoprotectant transport system permease protein
MGSPTPGSEGVRLMDTILDAFGWLFDPVNWQGTSGIRRRMIEHVLLSFQATLIAVAIALPIGLYLGHLKRLEFVALTIGNMGRALPSFGIIAFLFPLTFAWPGELGYWATFIALVFLSIPPILTNTYVGIKTIDGDTVEAARGMGMTELGVLMSLEIPLGVPLIIAGIRTAAVQCVATATLWAVFSGGGLGRFIVDGIASGLRYRAFAGGLLVAALALLTEGAFTVIEKILAPRTSTTAARYSGRPLIARGPS